MSGLSPFLREKWEYYFKFFDADGDGQIALNDLDLFHKNILNYTGWLENSANAREIYEVHQAFFEILIQRAEEKYGKHGTVDIDSWYKMWHDLTGGCMGMHNFPVWLRLLPRSLFKVIDRNSDGLIEEEELADFYQKIVLLEAGEAKRVAKRGFEEMTDFGRYPLNQNSYEQVFANFLLGRTPYGPGRYIFGCFEHKVEQKKFKLIQGPPEEQEQEMENRKSNLRRRGSDPMKVVLITRRDSRGGK